MPGINITLKDGTFVRVETLRIMDTYAGQLAGTFTVGTSHKLPVIKHKMEVLKARKAKGY